MGCILCAGLLLAPVTVLAWPMRSTTIHDGDSFKCVQAKGNIVTLRLYGIDAPEVKQPYGQTARKKLVEVLSRRKLDAHTMDTDRYGRTVAVVRTIDRTNTPNGRPRKVNQTMVSDPMVNEAMVNEASVNEIMVRAGLAWVYDQYCADEDICEGLRQAEAEARNARRGLWAQSDPTPPWVWRRQHKTEEWYAKPVRTLRQVGRALKGLW